MYGGVEQQMKEADNPVAQGLWKTKLAIPYTNDITHMVRRSCNDLTLHLIVTAPKSGKGWNCIGRLQAQNANRHWRRVHNSKWQEVCFATRRSNCWHDHFPCSHALSKAKLMAGKVLTCNICVPILSNLRIDYEILRMFSVGLTTKWWNDAVEEMGRELFDDKGLKRDHFYAQIDASWEEIGEETKMQVKHLISLFVIHSCCLLLATLVFVYEIKHWQNII